MLELRPLTNTPLSTHLTYVDEWYNIGDQYAVADLLRSYNVIDYNNKRDVYEMFSIYNNNKYIGVIGYESYTCDPSNAWLAWTFIIPEHRGKGFGKLAFNELFNIISKMKYNNLYIDSVPDTNTIKFYENLKFEHVGTCKQFRKNNSLYSKEILIYDKNPVFKYKLSRS
jgi:GNAT superfamily N-acetyltransferase